MQWRLHHLNIGGRCDDAALRAAWEAVFAALPAVEGEVADVGVTLTAVARVPDPPPGEPHFLQGDLLQYFVSGERVVAHFPRFGQLRLDLARGTTNGRLAPAALTTYGVLEDLLAISLAPHLRRRGLFLLHAFAATWRGRAALLVGGIGAGKTTSGLALLDAGWGLLSNDSPLIDEDGNVLAYPGRLAAYPETFARFEATKHLMGERPSRQGRAKITAAAESIWPDVWQTSAPPGAIFFPQIEKRETHALERLGPAEALRLLLPHAVEQWDRAMIPAHLAALRRLAERAPAYRLRLGPEVGALPAVLRGALLARE